MTPKTDLFIAHLVMSSASAPRGSAGEYGVTPCKRQQRQVCPDIVLRGAPACGHANTVVLALLKGLSGRWSGIATRAERKKAHPCFQRWADVTRLASFSPLHGYGGNSVELCVAALWYCLRYFYHAASGQVKANLFLCHKVWSSCCRLWSIFKRDECGWSFPGFDGRDGIQTLSP